MSTPRSIVKTYLAREQPEGAGATVRRAIGVPSLRNFTPFLMMDHFSVSPGAGFPDHPHRGMETITLTLSDSEGGVNHEDFAGNKGRLEPGDLQFMTAGRGIVHAEMPDPDKTVSGIQLWVDLPKHLKDCEPRYRDLKAKEIPIATADDGKVEVKVISGKSQGIDSVRDLAYTPVWFLEITIRPGGKIEQDLPADWNSFAYVVSGTANISNGTSQPSTISQYHNVVFSQSGDGVNISVDDNASEEAKIILVAGQPHNQPIVQYGPFVTTSKEEIVQAMMDYQTATNGFERAADWQSEIGKTMVH